MLDRCGALVGARRQRWQGRIPRRLQQQLDKRLSSAGLRRRRTSGRADDRGCKGPGERTEWCTLPTRAPVTQVRQEKRSDRTERQNGPDARALVAETSPAREGTRSSVLAGVPAGRKQKAPVSVPLQRRVRGELTKGRSHCTISCRAPSFSRAPLSRPSFRQSGRWAGGISGS